MKHFGQVRFFKCAIQTNLQRLKKMGKQQNEDFEKYKKFETKLNLNNKNRSVESRNPTGTRRLGWWSLDQNISCVERKCWKKQHSDWRKWKNIQGAVKES